MSETILQSFSFIPNTAEEELIFEYEKNLKNVYKIRVQRDFFKTCNKWSKW